MKQTVVALLSLWCSLEAQGVGPESLTVSDAELVNTSVPRWNGGLVLRHLDFPSGNFSASVYGRDKVKRDLDLRMPENPTLEIHDVCVYGAGDIAAAVSAVDGGGRRANLLMIFDASGSQKSTIRLNPYRVWHLVPGVKNDLWSFGQDESSSNGRVADHPMLYRFDSEGKVIGRYGLASELGLPPYSFSLGRMTSAPVMILSGDSVIVYLQLFNRMVEFDFDGKVRANRVVPPPAEPGQPTPRLRVFVAAGKGSSERLVASFDGQGYVLDKEKSAWRPIGKLTNPGFGKIIGRDGDRFVTWESDKGMAKFSHKDPPEHLR